MISGAIQHGVPTMLSLRVTESDSWAATPKSASFTSPFVFNKMFAHLMSLWILPLLCRKYTPYNTSRNTIAMYTSLPSVPPLRLIASFTEPPPTYSITMKSLEP